MKRSTENALCSLLLLLICVAVVETNRLGNHGILLTLVQAVLAIGAVAIAAQMIWPLIHQKANSTR